jgi:hypothetical protein
MASVFPGLAPEVSARRLAEYREPAVRATVGAGMLYLPPIGVRFASLVPDQAFSNGTAYGSKEQRAIADLARHSTPADFPVRRTSDPLFRAIVELGTNTTARDSYHRDPDAFMVEFPDLTEPERAAMRARTPGALRRATTTQPGSHARRAIDGLAEQVGVPVVARVLLH